MTNALRKRLGIRKEKIRDAVLSDAVIYCEGKKGYGSLTAALQQTLKGSKFDSGGRLHPYLCPRCRMYHNGKTVRKKKPRPKLDHSWDDEVY